MRSFETLDMPNGVLRPKTPSGSQPPNNAQQESNEFFDPVAENRPGSMPVPFAEISSLEEFRRPFWQAIERLYQAAKFAQDCECGKHEFSVTRQQLLGMGLYAEELLWLTKQHLIQGSQEAAAAGNATEYVITDKGIELVEQCLTMLQMQRVSMGSISGADLVATTDPSLKPAWDTDRHELSCAGKIVKKFKWRAANQEAILAAFEEDGWPAHIDDPLPQQNDIDPKRRLADAIKSLNRHQRVPLIRFCGDGTGEGVLWEFKR